MSTKLELENKVRALEEELKSLKEQLNSDKKMNSAILTQQAKLASMGEMFGNIAHQWRQPLMEISSLMMSSEAKIQIENEISQEEVLEMIHKSNDILKYMSHTIDDFRNFFSKTESKTEFTISKLFNKVLTIIANALRNKNIKFDLIMKDNPKIDGFANELAQVLINIIINARDILVLREIESRKIEVRVFIQENTCIIVIKDNAGGILVTPKEKIFEPLFTAEKKGGTGIGLYMSKLIVEDKMKGNLEVSNDNDGALFTITLPLK